MAGDDAGPRLFPVHAVNFQPEQARVLLHGLADEHLRVGFARGVLHARVHEARRAVRLRPERDLPRREHAPARAVGERNEVRLRPRDHFRPVEERAQLAPAEFDGQFVPLPAPDGGGQRHPADQFALHVTEEGQVLSLGTRADVIIILLILHTEGHPRHLLQFAAKNFEPRAELEIAERVPLVNEQRRPPFRALGGDLRQHRALRRHG